MELEASRAPWLPPHVPATTLTVGTFDGVHRGHLDVLARLVAHARETMLPSMLVTFEPHPLDVLNPLVAPHLLTTRDEKLATLAATGLDYVAIVPFTQKLAAQSAERFVDDVLLARFRMHHLLIGHDHGFGRGREGDVATLCALGAARGFGVEVVPPVMTDAGEAVSSTLIRRAVAIGDLDAATSGLGRPYGVSGRVVPGEARGRVLGVPTLNVLPESPRKLMPPDGVYAVQVSTPRGHYGGMLNLGGRPTFGDSRRTIEAHLFDASGDFYADVVEVTFVRRLRDTVRFADAGALRMQLTVDEGHARRALTALAESDNVNGSTHVTPSTL